MCTTWESLDKAPPLLLPNYKIFTTININSPSPPMQNRPIPLSPRQKHSLHSVNSVYFLSTPYSNLFQQKNYYYIYNIYYIYNSKYYLYIKTNKHTIIHSMKITEFTECNECFWNWTCVFLLLNFTLIYVYMTAIK